MKKVHIVCEKQNEADLEFWILGVFSSKKRAQSMIDFMHARYPNYFQYINTMLLS